MTLRVRRSHSTLMGALKSLSMILDPAAGLRHLRHAERFAAPYSPRHCRGSPGGRHLLRGRKPGAGGGLLGLDHLAGRRGGARILLRARCRALHSTSAIQ